MELSEKFSQKLEEVFEYSKKVVQDAYNQRIAPIKTQIEGYETVIPKLGDQKQISTIRAEKEKAEKIIADVWKEQFEPIYPESAESLLEKFCGEQINAILIEKFMQSSNKQSEAREELQAYTESLKENNK